MYIDTHCHLDSAEFAADRDAVASAAIAAGVSGIVVPAISAGNFADVRDCCRRYLVCAPAYGIHPLYVGQAAESDLAVLRSWLEIEATAAQPPVAVGEIGLDFYVDGFDLERQTHFFVEQLKIARDFNLPVLLHLRRAQDAVLKAVRRVFGKTGVSGIAHAFNGSRQQAQAFIDLGLKLGFGGAMTFTGSLRIRELAATLPLDCLVLETDAPDMAPAFIGRNRNSPENLPRIAAVLAGLRGMTPQAVAEAMAENTRVVLPGLRRIHNA